MSNEGGFVEALRKEGASLLTAWLRTDDDLTLLIRQSVTQDTFRAFANLKRPPSSIFRGWAASRLEANGLGGLLRVQNVLEFDCWLSELAHDLGRYWKREAGTPL